MCLAIPGQIEALFDERSMKMAKVNFGGIRKSVCLEYAQSATVGDYVLVHVGFAISIIDEEEAMRSLLLLDGSEELKELQAQDGNEVPP